MFTKSLVSVGLVASGVLGHDLLKRDIRSCSAPEPTDEQLNFSAQLAVDEAAARKAGSFGARAAINIQTYFHVVSSSQAGVNAVTDSILNQQLSVLNNDYGPGDVSFTLAGTTRTVDSTWAVDGDEIAMKSELRAGGYDSLNVYFTDSLGDGTLGYCYFPDNVSEGSTDFIRDGCSVIIGSLPGGDAPFDLGKTTTHEVGHWLGLYHTFQGGCSGNGDFVDDTPAQSSPSSGCPLGRDSCPSQPGDDPVTNFMDYSDDACMEEFSSGQYERIYSYWDAYRA